MLTKNIMPRVLAADGLGTACLPADTDVISPELGGERLRTQPGRRAACSPTTCSRISFLYLFGGHQAARYRASAGKTVGYQNYVHGF